jgi:guanine nucleotide-binding protein subunit beta-2-like 1 protein
MTTETLKVSVEFLGVLRGHNGWVTSLTVGEKGGKPLLVSGGRDRTVLVWDIDTDLLNPQAQSTQQQQQEDNKEKREIGKPYRALKGHNHFVSCLTMTNDSKYVVSGSWDKTLRLWDLNTFKTKHVLVGHTKDVVSCAFSSDNRAIYSGSMDKTIIVWNVNGERQHTEDKEMKGWVSSIINIKKGKEGPLIAVGGWDCSVKFFDIHFGKIKAIGTIDYPVVGLATDNEGEFLFVAEKNGKIKIWGLSKGEGNDELQQEYDVGTDLHCINYEHKYFGIFSYGSANGLTIKDLSQNQDIFKYSYGKNNACLCIAFDQSKKYLFAGFSDGLIRVYKFSSESSK